MWEVLFTIGSRSSRSPSESPDRMSSFDNNPHIRAGSIKAWKEEQERIRQEQELEEQLAEEKKSKAQARKVLLSPVFHAKVLTINCSMEHGSRHLRLSYFTRGILLVGVTDKPRYLNARSSALSVGY